ncbi:MAG: 50S ribosomal protein L22 [Candidatus Kerfeldbacteria bacterium]|nr:50S ribosomal protein L22 [Candidatus Kerfeldbacteria bacterium]
MPDAVPSTTAVSARTVRASLRFLRVAPRKVRLVLDLIRGLSVEDAMDQLRTANRAVAQPLLKLLESAAANAEHEREGVERLTRDHLYVKMLVADEGPKLKRYQPRAYGRAGMIRKRSSHVHLVLGVRAAPSAGTTKPARRAKKPSASAATSTHKPSNA